MQILDGQLVARAVKEELTIKVAQLIAEGKKVPHLAAVLVGNDGASETYVSSKVKTCHDIGFKSTLIRLADDITEYKLLSTIQNLNSDPDIDGILVQLPLPKSISDENVIQCDRSVQRCGRFSSVKCGKNGTGPANFSASDTSWDHALVETL